ncbi:MAG: nucleoid-associated protein, YbaB/EbfC family [Deltaproteobacteria bacterium RIFOXYD12_FULL_50_9]|nr:MAG: nucleoid-associated protein, YbaB/EbfC family [Deltaproteobacteria bacterium RIFOXYD12_FULL_50_9]
MNMEQMMKQAQQFQQRLVQVQEELAKKRVSSTVGGGMVTVTVNGRHEVLSLAIDPAVINPTEQVMLQDLIVAAVNDAMNKAQTLAQQEMAQLTGGIQIPGLF